MFAKVVQNIVVSFAYDNIYFWQKRETIIAIIFKCIVLHHNSCS